jgi:hypothetical protein
MCSPALTFIWDQRVKYRTDLRYLKSEPSRQTTGLTKKSNISDIELQAKDQISLIFESLVMSISLSLCNPRPTSSLFPRSLVVHDENILKRCPIITVEADPSTVNTERVSYSEILPNYTRSITEDSNPC